MICHPIRQIDSLPLDSMELLPTNKTRLFNQWVISWSIATIFRWAATGVASGIHSVVNEAENRKGGRIKPAPLLQTFFCD
jgi:hypothetical protein